VLVIGGGVAGTQAAAEIAQMGHRVELVERRPFLGGRAARIGSVFPTNDCGQCLPTSDEQAGVRKCFHRNQVIDHPDLHIWRRTTVESVKGRPGDFEVALRRLPNIVTDACVNCGTCETVCPVDSSRAGQEGDLHRVLRRPRGAHRRPRDLHLLRQVRRGVPGRRHRLHAVAGARAPSASGRSSPRSAASPRLRASSSTSATATTA
jgi:ferredoxin